MSIHRPIAAADAIGIHLLDYTIPNFDLVRNNVANATSNASIDVQSAAERLTNYLICKVEKLSADKGTAYQCHEDIIASLLAVSERPAMSAEQFGQAKPIVIKAWKEACEHKRNFRTREEELAALEHAARSIC